MLVISAMVAFWATSGGAALMANAIFCSSEEFEEESFPESFFVVGDFAAASCANAFWQGIKELSKRVELTQRIERRTWLLSI